MLIKRIDRQFKVRSIQADLRKLGVNLVTGGIGTIFLANLTELSGVVFATSSCVMMVGIICIVLGTWRII